MAVSLRCDVRMPLASGFLEVSLASDQPAVALVGPSGAGKTTLLRILAGVERRATGVVDVAGVVWQDTRKGVWVPPWERRVGWVPQDSLLFPHLTVRQNLAYGGADDAAIAGTAELLRAAHLLDRRPRRLSGGERQRVALARALLSAPRLLLLDEPFSALDRPLRMELAATLREWTRSRAVPLVLVSHDEEDARTLADERWHLVDGHLSRPGDPRPG
ncbi:MAG: ATP-binding cassette domain-containing protein [Longimicrobiales bacterium]